MQTGSQPKKQSNCANALQQNSPQISPMKSLNPSPESCRRNGVMGLGLIPAHGPATISINVSHGLSRYEVAVPSNSSFGYLKSVLTQNIGLKPEMYKIFFGGIEKEDDEDIQVVGVKNNSEVLLMEVMACEQKVPEEVQETCVISKGEADVAEVRKEVDKLAQQVSALQAVVDSGNKVDDKEIIYLTEMLMRQLLKLDGIEAEGEGKVQRKMEVHRIQSIVETLDTLKSRNSNSYSTKDKNVSLASQWRAFDPGCQSVNTSSPVPSSAPSPMPFSASSPMPFSFPSPMSHFTPYTIPSPAFSTVPYSVPSPLPYFNPYNPASSASSPVPYYTSPTPYFTPSTLPSPIPSPVPYYFPAQVPSSAPFSLPSPSKVTQNWQHFE